MEDNKNIFPPRHRKIKDHIYAFKDALINDFFAYRCKYRNKCNVVIKIDKVNLKIYR